VGAGHRDALVVESIEPGHNVMHGQWDWMNDRAGVLRPTSLSRVGSGAAGERQPDPQ
jgi:hypothetical protein